jgi:hypothetical protein
VLGHAPRIDAEKPESASSAGSEKTCDARRSEQCQDRMLSSAGRGRRRKAPSISPSFAPPLPAVLHAHPTAPRRAQRHGRRRRAAARPAAATQERRRAPDDTLRRQLPRVTKGIRPLCPMSAAHTATQLRRNIGILTEKFASARIVFAQIPPTTRTFYSTTRHEFVGALVAPTQAATHDRLRVAFRGPLAQAEPAPDTL